jgi:hypothetical protein
VSPLREGHKICSFLTTGYDPAKRVERIAYGVGHMALSFLRVELTTTRIIFTFSLIRL